jgi:hypothetical protein
MGIEASKLRDGGRLKDIRAFIDELNAHDLYAKRFYSLSSATLGVMSDASLAVAMTGQTLAQALQAGDHARDQAGFWPAR